MMERHILEILDEKGLDALSGAEFDTVRAHASHCAECRRGLEAARVSAALLTARASVSAPAPSAFFQTKVLAAIREKQNIRKPIEAFRRWWQAAYPVVCSMLFFVITLAMLTVLAPRPDSAQASTFNLYSTDSVILNQNPPRSLSDEQALEVIYNERRAGDAVKR